MLLKLLSKETAEGSNRKRHGNECCRKKQKISFDDGERKRRRDSPMTGCPMYDVVEETNRANVCDLACETTDGHDTQRRKPEPSYVYAL